MTQPRLSRMRLLLVGVVVLFLGRLLLCDFTWWDDEFTIHHNRLMINVGWDTFADNWKNPSADIYIPITYTVWGVVAYFAHVAGDAQNIALNPTFFHATNLAVHIGGALAAFALLRRLVGDDRAALLGAALWAVHPVQVESVGWLSGLKDVLSGTLALTALALYVRWRQERKRWVYFAALAAFVLAMLSKPSAFTAPLLLTAIDLLALRTPWKKVALALCPFFLATIPIALIAKLIQPAMMTVTKPWLRPLVAGDSLAFYIVKVLLPITLTFDYGHRSKVILASGEIWVGWLLPAAVAGGMAVWYRRHRRAGRPLGPLPAVAALLFVLAPVHVLGLSQFDFQFFSNVADHYLYVAMIGPALLLAWAVRDRGRNAYIAAAVLVAAYGARAAWQTPVWQNEDALHNHAIAVNPNSWVSYINRAGQTGGNNGSIEDQERDLLIALKIEPSDLTANLSLMGMYMTVGDYEAADVQARLLLNYARDIWVDDPQDMAGTYRNVAAANLTIKRLDAAGRYIDEGLKYAPGNPTLLQLRKRLEWMRNDPNIHAASEPATTQPITTQPD